MLRVGCFGPVAKPIRRLPMAPKPGNNTAAIVALATRMRSMRLQPESRPTIATLFLALLLPLCGAAPVAAQVSRLGSSFSVPLLAPAGVRFEGVAYDSINNVYLAITGAVTIRGQFI